MTSQRVARAIVARLSGKRPAPTAQAMAELDRFTARAIARNRRELGSRVTV